MRVRVLYFHTLRPAAGGLAAEDFDLPEGAVLGDLVDAAIARHPGIGPFRPSLLLAVDKAYAEPSAPLADGAEVALMPPVSGG